MNLTDTQLLLITQFGFPVVVGIVAYLYRHLVAKLPDATRAKIEATVIQAVQAVEQAQNLVPGAVKKEYATNLANTLLKAASVKATAAQVDTLIEAAVYAMNQGRPKFATTVVPAVK
jgi:LL-H family phage holin